MVVQRFLDGRVVLHCGDCLEVMASLPGGSVDSVVCDPPYHLTSIVKRFGGENAAPAKHGTDGAFKRASAGFMGKRWDGGDVAFRPETWAAVLRVLKPGGHLLAFSGTRTYHRMACAIEDAGFECRDMIGWLYGSGFPKSHNLAAQWSGWGSALKPALEPICVARKPLIGTIAENVLEHGTGALNIDGCRVASDESTSRPGSMGVGSLTRAIVDHGARPATSAWKGAKEAPRETLGRWPANVIHDGSDEVVAAFPDATGQQGRVSGNEPSECHSGVYSGPRNRQPFAVRGDSGSAARFFYTAKADGDDRLGSRHPTVKPLDLMRYLVRMVTPKGGTVLDPFAGTGTTGEAAFWEGFSAVLVEREPEYQADIRRRMSLVLGGQNERRYASIKAKGLTEGAGPLFGGMT